jgi:hypothetical protein
MTAASPMGPAITVVSGVPRSGTSLMMQMLAAGGMALIHDGQRPADRDNPRGYWEYRLSLSTAIDSSWLVHERAPGKAVKVMYRQLYDLPYDFSYRVLFLQRDLREVVRSQNRMAERLHGTRYDEGQLIRAFQAELDELRSWLPSQPHIRLLEVAHADLFTRAPEICAQVVAFVEHTLDLQAMLEAIDASLYRNRAATEAAPAS